MGHLSPKRKQHSPQSKAGLQIQPAKAALRRRYHQTHLQTWAYDHFRFANFRGWITTSPENKSYALGKPVLCLIRSTNSSEVVKIHLKLFRRQGRRGGAQQGTYYALIRVGGGWMNEQDWFRNFTIEKARIPNYDAKWWSFRSGSGPKDSVMEDQVKPSDWVDLGHKFRLLDLPRDVFDHISQFVADKPPEFLFEQDRMTKKGRYTCNYFPGHRDLINYSRVCKGLNSAVNSWCYSTSTFVFQSRAAFFQFLSEIGEQNRSRLKKVVLQLTCYDYFDIFTPGPQVSMLDVPIWSFQNIKLRAMLPTLRLEELVIRIPDGSSMRGEYAPPSYDDSPIAARLVPQVDISWIMMSVLEVQREMGFANRLRFEAANAPHRTIETGPPYVLDWEVVL
ncbi:hypothetical protein NA57DRAFT_71393 [Rhizodiscina lignyota]|uniref:Uncharacterized protein n=1 Tax=Rhizodiscina lignyota TaxID=1504668 RepID=A0A9P4IMX7_9PEZI|nr:hypothetical protein NA57DRAFT_71393 [Rhizodiscina lignyota]